MPPLITFLGVLLAIYVLVECVNVFMIGSSMTRSLIRIARQIFHGSKDVALPEDLKIAAANGLLTVGSEVVVGDQHQWDGVTVKRFAVAPSIVHAESGVVMQIIRITRDRMELKPLTNADYTATINN